jgi:hypothetical protein
MLNKTFLVTNADSVSCWNMLAVRWRWGRPATWKYCSGKAIQAVAFGVLMFVGESAHAQTTIPGCSGPNLDPTTQSNCTLARELLDAYNGKIESDTSIIKEKGGNYELCYKNYNSAMASEARIWDADRKQLEKQGDKTAELDAAKKVRNTMMVITTHLQSCLAQRTPRQSF